MTSPLNQPFDEPALIEREDVPRPGWRYQYSVVHGGVTIPTYDRAQAYQLTANMTGGAYVARHLVGPSEPDVKCDGNHAAPACGDPECWQDDSGRVAHGARTAPCAFCKRTIPVRYNGNFITHDIDPNLREVCRGSEKTPLGAQLELYSQGRHLIAQKLLQELEQVIANRRNHSTMGPVPPLWVNGAQWAIFKLVGLLHGKNRPNALPRRDDDVEAWLKTWREKFNGHTHDEPRTSNWYVLDDMLDEYRERADTGRPLVDGDTGEQEAQDEEGQAEPTG